MTSSYEFHPYADLFPMFEDSYFDELCGDISENGQREPILLYNGKILDGRNRYRACLKLGIEPCFEESTSATDADALSESVSRNLYRRHLTTSQAAMVASKLLPLYGELAKARQGQRTDILAKLPECFGNARDEVAKLCNVSPRTIQSAKSVRENGVPELERAVTSGDIAVASAAKVSRLDAALQYRQWVVHTVGVCSVENISQCFEADGSGSLF